MGVDTSRPRPRQDTFLHSAIARRLFSSQVGLAQRLVDFQSWKRCKKTDEALEWSDSRVGRANGVGLLCAFYQLGIGIREKSYQSSQSISSSLFSLASFYAYAMQPFLKVFDNKSFRVSSLHPLVRGFLCAGSPFFSEELGKAKEESRAGALRRRQLTPHRRKIPIQLGSLRASSILSALNVFPSASPVQQ